MAPRSLVRDLQPEEIAEKCGMSYTAALIQYNHIHNIH